MAVNTLYPPIVDTYMPAFIITENGKNVGDQNCRIYFSLSRYNSLAEKEDSGSNDGKVRSVWVSITNQYTNASVVKISSTKSEDTIYKSGLIDFDRDSIYKDGENDRYYIDINHSMLQEEEWEQGQTYKVQLRFCSSKDYTNDMTWPVENSNLFSEWSTVCLVQSTMLPTITIDGFNEDGIETIRRTFDNTISGKISFKNQDIDYLHSYQIQLFKEDDLTKIEYDTGVLYPNWLAQNEINCDLEYAFQDGVRYKIKLFINTEKLYSTVKEYSFYVLDTSSGRLDATISAIAENELGRIKVTINSETEKAYGNFTIRRASVKTNFTIWEDVATISLTGGDLLNFDWYDYGIETGIWYKYCAHRRSYYGNRGISILTKEPVMAFFDDIFLVGKNEQQLKIKFNPQIGSYSKTILESSTQTIGSKYPFVKRNGYVNYKQFQISGLISHFMDENELFINKDELYFNSKKLYDKYNEKNRITLYNDFNLERQFRQKVENFLTDGEVKLFKSTTEGTMLVKLMNVSFNSEPTLGRMLYSFTATAIEIDDYSIKNLDKYEIQPLGQYKILYKEELTKTIIKNISQDNFVVNSGNAFQSFNLWSFLQNEEKDLAKTNNRRNIQKINSLYIDFLIDPYFIKITETGMIIVKTWNDNSITDNDNLTLGYIIKIGTKEFLVGANGKYQIDFANITEEISIKIPNKTFTESDAICAVQVNYTVTEQEDEKLLPNYLNYYNIIGCESGGFIPTDNIIRDFIYEKYKARYGNTTQWSLFALHDLLIEAQPNSVFYIRNDIDSYYDRFVMNDTGILNLSGGDYSLTGLYGLGIHLMEKEKLGAVYKYAETEDYEYNDCTTLGSIKENQTILKNIDEIYERVIDPDIPILSFNEEQKKLLQTFKLTLEQNEPFLQLTKEERLDEQRFLQKNGVYKVQEIDAKDPVILKELMNFQGEYGNEYLELLSQWTSRRNINEGYYNIIYYKKNWYLFSEENKDVICPLGVYLSYYGEKEEGVYSNEN